MVVSVVDATEKVIVGVCCAGSHLRIYIYVYTFIHTHICRKKNKKERHAYWGSFSSLRGLPSPGIVLGDDLVPRLSLTTARAPPGVHMSQGQTFLYQGLLDWILNAIYTPQTKIVFPNIPGRYGLHSVPQFGSDCKAQPKAP